MNGQIFLMVLLLAAVAIVAGVFALWMIAVRRPAPDIPTDAEYPTPDFSDPAGFAVTGLPRDSIITLQSSRLKGGKIGELSFLVEPGWPATLRLARTGTDLELTDFAQQYDARTIRDIGGTRVVFSQNPGREHLMTWTKAGFDYALYYPEAEQGLAAGLLDDFVNEIDASVTR